MLNTEAMLLMKVLNEKSSVLIGLLTCGGHYGKCVTEIFDELEVNVY